MWAAMAGNHIGKRVEIGGVVWTIQGEAPKSGRFHASRIEDGRTLWIEVRKVRGSLSDWEEARDGR